MHEREHCQEIWLGLLSRGGWVSLAGKNMAGTAVLRRWHAFAIKVRQHLFAEQTHLCGAIFAPEFQQNVRAAGGTELFQALDALLRGTRNGADLIEYGIGDSTCG